jgi:hypothetical protein
MANHSLDIDELKFIDEGGGIIIDDLDSLFAPE